MSDSTMSDTIEGTIPESTMPSKTKLKDNRQKLMTLKARVRYRKNDNNNLFIYRALFNMLGDQKRITTINNLKTINTNIRNIQIYLISKRY